MAYESQAILRSLLYQAKRAKTLKQVVHAVEAMCQKDDISSVEALLAKEAAEEAEGEA